LVKAAEAPAGWRGGAVFKKINLLINTTPALRATPPHLRRGILSPYGNA
jgi:hypothetical protein